LQENADNDDEDIGKMTRSEKTRYMEEKKAKKQQEEAVAAAAANPT